MGCEFLPEVALRYCRRHDLPFVITALHHPAWTGTKFRHYDRIFRAADAVIALTEWERKTLIESRSVDAKRVHVTGIGPILAPDYSVEAFRDRFDLRGRFMLFVGRKAAHKGWATLLQAAPRILAADQDLRIVFIGPDTSISERAFAAADSARVINLGAVDLTTKTAAIAGCELLALPSTGESFGGVITEAWSFAKPVVAVDIPSVACVVTDGSDGLLVSPESGPLADAVSELLADPARATEMGANGFRKVKERYDWQRIAEKTLAIYRAVSSSR
jgi:glycosyltransferase involved in cell wall biosynthesis